MSERKIRLSLDVSDELNHTLEEMAEIGHCSKSDILRRSIALMEVALQEKKQGHKLGIIGKNKQVLKEIVGL